MRKWMGWCLGLTALTACVPPYVAPTRDTGVANDLASDVPGTDAGDAMGAVDIATVNDLGDDRVQAPDVPAPTDTPDVPDGLAFPDGNDVPDAPDVPQDVSCPSGQTRCGDGTCIDPNFSDTHCGGCERPACVTGRVCRVGRCVVSPTDLALGSSHTCARIARPGCSGTFCWGSDERCALGLRAVTPESDAGAADAGSPDASVCAADAGVVTFSGCIPYGQQSTAARLRDFGTVIGLSAGASHTCALVDDPTRHGTVYCWGHNGYGQVGDGTRQNRAGPTRVSIAERVVQVAAGGYHTCALTARGEVYCWGTNEYGELGADRNCGRCPAMEGADQYAYRCHPSPVRVEDLPQASQIALNANNTCVVTRAGTVICWGYNGEGQLGVFGGTDGGVSGPSARRTVSRLINTVQVGLGNGYGCALTEGGEVYCWGNNTGCGLGVVTPTGSSYEPVLVRDLANVTQIALGFAHVCALQGGANAVSCWGYNAQHQLGVPSGMDTAMLCSGSMDRSRQTPIRAMGTGDVGTIRQVAVNGYHTCVLNDRQEVWCWGYGEQGQLGDNRRTTPAPDIARPVIGICP